MKPVVTSEADIQKRIQTLSTGDVRLFRMQVGEYWTGVPSTRQEQNGTLTVTLRNARRVTVGVPGMSDLIGLKSITVTPEMIGQRVAVFTGIEVKSATGRPTVAQASFLTQVSMMGGLAGIARSVEDARFILKL